jgi:hypothetical protein
MGDAGDYGQPSRSIFHSIYSVIEILELIALFFVLGAQTLVFLFRAQMLCLLSQTVETIKQATQHGEAKHCKKLQPAFMETDAANVGTRTGSAGNNKCVETVISGHYINSSWSREPRI